MAIRKFLQISKFQTAGDKTLFDDLEDVLKSAGYTVFNDTQVFTFYKEKKKNIEEDGLEEPEVEQLKEDHFIEVKTQILSDLYNADAKSAEGAISYSTDFIDILNILIKNKFVDVTDDNKLFLTELGIYEYKTNLEESD